MAPGLQVCTACYYTEQHKIKSSTREDDAMKRPDKHKMYEADTSTPHPTIS